MSRPCRAADRVLTVARLLWLLALPFLPSPFLFHPSSLILDLAAADVVLDAVVAEVGPRVITLSDLRLARHVRLADAAASDEEVLTFLVNRTLMLLEVERFQPPDPPTIAIQEAFDKIRARLGPDAWSRALRNSGVDEAYLRALVRENLRLDAYLRQRFETLADPTDEEVRTAYAEQRAPTAEASQPFEALRQQLRERLRARRLDALVAEWITELRARTPVRTYELTTSPVE
jgi:hypothetical protein